MGDYPDIAVQGWEAIAKAVGWNLRTAYRRRQELQEAGVIFYKRSGHPPTRKVYHFPSLLKAWTGRKAAKGEMV